MILPRLSLASVPNSTKEMAVPLKLCIFDTLFLQQKCFWESKIEQMNNFWKGLIGRKKVGNTEFGPLIRSIMPTCLICF